MLLITLLWIVFFSFTLQLKVNFLLDGDEPGYLNAAKKLYYNFQLDDGRPLLISAINGFPLLFGIKSQYLNYWIFVINISSWLATVFFIFAILKSKINEKSAFFTTLIFVFCVGSLAITFKILSESVFVMFFVLGVFLTNKYLNSNNYKYFCWAISVFFLTSLIKPIAFGMTFILMGFFIKSFKSMFLSKFSVIILLSASLVFYQMYTLKKNYGNFTISYIDGYTYYNYLGTRADCLKNNTKFIQCQNSRFTIFGKFSHVDQKKIVLEDFKNQLSTNTLNLIKAYFINIISNSAHGSPFINNCKNDKNTYYFNFFRLTFKIISKMQNIVLTFLGVYLSFHNISHYKTIDKLFLVLSILFFYIFLVSAISSDQGDRLHLILFPLVILMLTHIVNKINFKKIFFATTIQKT